MKRVLIILGPTATGKTDLALIIAHKYDGEIVSCDSRQVYQGLDIGTGKLPSQNSKVKIQKFQNYWLVDEIPVFLYDVADPKTQYTVKDYQQAALKKIEDIAKRKKLPIIVGGTGLYLKALLEGIPNLDIPTDQSKREDLSSLNLIELQQKLMKVNPQKWVLMNNSDRKNPRRLLRYIELAYMYPYAAKNQNANIKSQNYDTLLIGLTAPRSVIDKKIYQRLISRIDQGLIDEGRSLLKQGVTLERMKALGLEYGCLAEFLEGKINQDQFTVKLQAKIHQYSKRQLTWFKKTADVTWFDITDNDFSNKVDNTVYAWYYSNVS